MWTLNNKCKHSTSLVRRIPVELQTWLSYVVSSRSKVLLCLSSRAYIQLLWSSCKTCLSLFFSFSHLCTPYLSHSLSHHLFSFDPSHLSTLWMIIINYYYMHNLLGLTTFAHKYCFTTQIGCTVFLHIRQWRLLGTHLLFTKSVSS